MWCFLRASARKKHHMYSHTPEFTGEPVKCFLVKILALMLVPESPSEKSNNMRSAIFGANAPKIADRIINLREIGARWCLC